MANGSRLLKTIIRKRRLGRGRVGDFAALPVRSRLAAARLTGAEALIDLI